MDKVKAEIHQVNYNLGKEKWMVIFFAAFGRNGPSSYRRYYKSYKAALIAKERFENSSARP